MKSLTQKLTVLTVAGVVLAGGAFAAQGEQGKHGGPHRQEMLQKYDANKDGKLDEQERQKAHQDMLARYDANKDGKLDDTERAAMRKDVAAERFKALDKDGNGQLSLEEFQAGFAQGGFGHEGQHGERDAR